MLEISLSAETLFKIGNFPVTNAFLTSLVVFLLIAIFSVFVAVHSSLAPRNRLYLAFEALVDYIYSLSADVLASRALARKVLPLLLGFFVFITFNNWFGLIPGVGSISLHTASGEGHLLRGANASLNTTLALAIVSVVVTNYYGAKQLGFFSHLKRFFNFSSPINFGIGLIELVSEFAKVISFSFRLFGNIFAGEVLLAVISFLAPLFAPLPFFALEIFVGIVQALVFMMLTLVFLRIATEEAH